MKVRYLNLKNILVSMEAVIARYVAVEECPRCSSKNITEVNNFFCSMCEECGLFFKSL